MRLLPGIVFSTVAFAASAGDMVTIPAGDFSMGRSKLTSDDNTNMRPHILLDDRPVHKVRISSFRLDVTEVANEQYAKFVAATKHRFPYHWPEGRIPDGAASLPVYNVSWDDANAFCQWAGKRLPTEAEWERAARGGVEGMDYPTGDKVDAKLARYNVETGPSPVGSFSPNAFGLQDMAGNESEWTADWFDGAYYKISPAKDPQGPSTGEYKVIRGGAWSDSPKRITVFFRNWVRPSQRTPNIGFRCAQ